MSNQYMVSIVTPSYNQAQFLEETILSVLNQDYPHIEYMVIDGGSSDSSVEVIKKYQDQLAYWISEKDKGQSHAINKGWQRAQGQIWAYLNSDDILLPGAVETVVQAFNNHPEAGVIYGNCLYIDIKSHELGQLQSKQCDFDKLLRDGQGPYICQPASFYRADLVQKVDLIDETLHLSMDYDLLLKLARITEMVYISQVLAGFRVHTTAKSATSTDRHYRESFQVRSRYGGRYLLKPYLQYWRYRLLRMMPQSAQSLFRRWRNSVQDQVYLRIV